MRITIRRGAVAGLATLGLTALLAGCAAAPAQTAATSAGPAVANFLPCMVSDEGGFDDKSFNQSGFEGLNAASKTLGVTPKTVQSAAVTDYAPNLTNLVAEKCNLIVTVGFMLADATKASATADPKINFAIVDDTSIKLPNVKPIVFNTAPAAFLAGYAAASYTKTGVVGTFGGVPIPPVTIFMDGYVDGVTYFNQQKGKTVKVLGWDVASQNGVFTGGFAAGVEAKTAAQGLIDQGADVIMPVGGPIFLSAGEAIRDSGKAIAMIGVDADTYLTSPALKDLFLTSVLKEVGAGVSDAVAASAAGTFTNAQYVGTLANGGVGLAPFHDFASKVDTGLQAELDTIKAGIIAGTITVVSPSSPK